MKDKPVNRPDKLKPHEKKFLEDYYREKRQKEQQDGTSENNKL